jgi:exosortase
LIGPLSTILVVVEGSDLATSESISPAPQTPGLSTEHGLRPSVLVGCLAIFAALVWSYAEPLAALADRWTNDSDYSHGFLVPVFAAYLLWVRRGMFNPQSARGSWFGLALLLCAASMRWFSTFFFYPLLDAPSLLPCLAGVALLVGGWSALHWAWPGIVYLGFMMPLPAVIDSFLSHPLQRVATISSTWLLQLLGVPAISRGNVIWLTAERLGVIDACSGLRMLLVFLAITVGASFLIQRPLWEKVFVGLSALFIGVVANVLRITVTAILYEYVGKEWAERVFHDLAGWLMMPLAMLLLWFELYLLSKILVTPVKSDPVLIGK